MTTTTADVLLQEKYRKRATADLKRAANSVYRAYVLGEFHGDERARERFLTEVAELIGYVVHGAKRGIRLAGSGSEELVSRFQQRAETEVRFTTRTKW